jgi:hypothetical protein
MAVVAERERRPVVIPTPSHNGFGSIKHAVAEQFQRMIGHELFRTTVDKDAMWETYIGAFPEGTNPIYRKRTEHDCSCCRQFIRVVGNVVAVINGELVSIWDVDCGNPTYAAVARAMSALVKSHPIDNLFLHTEGKAGTDKNFEDTLEGVKTWEHFFVNIPNSKVCRGAEIGPKLSESRALHDVLLRSLTELTLDVVDTVLELIAQNSLYRGEEHKHAVSTFKQMKTQFDRLKPEERDGFVWLKIGELPGSVSKIRNTSIGTLLTDLSEGRDMEEAVKSFEAMVAPANYKRPTALVTKAMIAKARETVEALGLTSALERRYATLTDITANNILFADRSAKKVMAGDVFDDLATATAIKPKTFDKVEEVGIDKFIADILPRATAVEILVENRHAGNLVSLIAPADPTAKELFKWDNRFCWSYNGDFADSIRERVKRAGGNVSGDLCCRLAWSNYDDLDFHMREPNGLEVAFFNKGPSSNGGQLDVDMNAGGPRSREPVENIFYGNSARMQEGVYTLFVHQYAKRESTDVGFEAEIDFKGDARQFAYDKAVKQNEAIVVAEMRYTRSNGIEFIKSLPATTISKKVWGIDTQSFHKVNVAMLSPNHWDGHGVGNKHYFFMLDGCQNDGTARGFYNEFLKTELDPHRKVFEMVGSKMRTDETANQLSGLGFSSTQRNHAIVRVSGAFTRTVRVAF